ncbi:chitin synthesis regulation, congo red resistance, RCR protein, partial [Clohesyomyces aquaticus]
RCRDQYGNYYYCQSAWNDWVRWVVLAVIIIGFFLLFVLCSCITARRRRKAGRNPFYGTGWAARPGQPGAQPYYNNQYAQPNQPAPPYTPQPQSSYYGANQGYYQQQPYGQQQGVELQPPQAAHPRGGDDVYSPPSGPPPGK